jgi:hypothetical protein
MIRKYQKIQSFKNVCKWVHKLIYELLQLKEMIMTFKHPVVTKELEGTYIKKSTSTGEYVFLSDNTFGNETKIYDHTDIASFLRDLNISASDLEESEIERDTFYISYFLGA